MTKYLLALFVSAMLSICVIAPVSAVEVSVGRLDTAEGFSRWRFSNGPEFPGAKGSFTQAVDTDGTRVGALNFDFSGGGNYVRTDLAIPPDAPAGQISFRVKKTVPNSLCVRITDSENQTFQKRFDFTHRSWQRVRVSLSHWSQGWSSWGGRADGVFRGKPVTIGIVVNAGGVAKGRVLISDVRMLSEAARRRTDKFVSIPVARFSDEEGWTLTQSFGNQSASHLKNSVFRYDFSGNPERVGIESDLPIIGHPESMTLSLSGMKGTAVIVKIGSHFDSFERSFTLERDGEQTLRAKMGKLEEWTHAGPESTIPSLPLRLVGVYVQNKGGDKQGSLILREFRVTTAVSTAREIMLVPDGRAVDGRARFTCYLLNMLGKAAVKLTAIVKDWEGNTVYNAVRKVSLRELGPTRKEVFAFPMSGRGFLECEFAAEAECRIFGPVSACAVAKPVVRSGSVPLDPESPFGMGVYLYRSQGEERETKAAMAAAAGVKWSREEFQWWRIQPQRGVYDFSYYDDLLNTAAKNGISVYGLLGYWAPWTKPFTQEGIDDYCVYCKALVGRYKDRIKHWEIWNEPNIFFWDGPKEIYPKLLKAVYWAIKEADPEAQVLGCSTCGIDGEFIDMVMKAGGVFDILTIHPYREILDDEVFIKELQDVHRLTAKYDGKKKPVWITEMGWSTHLYGGVSEREQASLLSRCYLSALASGVPTNISWYDFRNDGDNPFYNEMRFGTLHRDYHPKPSYQALKTICTELAGYRHSRTLKLSEGLIGLELERKGSKAYAVWSPKRDRLVSVAGLAAADRVVGIMGDVAERHGVGLKRSVIVVRAGCPVIIKRPDTNHSSLSFGEGLVYVAPVDALPGGEFEVSVKGSGAVDASKVAVFVDGCKVKKVKSDKRGKQVFRVSVPNTAKAGKCQVVIKAPVGEPTAALRAVVEIVPESLDI